jgi:hypothetical protein
MSFNACPQKRKKELPFQKDTEGSSAAQQGGREGERERERG